ncbi:VOC family protein [Jatrophihabitans sp.]|uniref:VOC family protein n=1 Tax=Jatrophihabitans sp. TaxID=1932789 RepID=UPI0030C76BD8|nr:Glyoxalase/bleomycin resistance protein/dioxygenase [Jatrophihabitans sp.]
MASVLSLGYALISATDLSEWKAFAVDLLGLQIASETDDRLLLRMDEKSYRLDVRRHSEAGGVTTLGWEVKGAAELEELSASLEAAGFVVKPADSATIAERMVSGLSSFEDPDGLTLELFWGLKTDKDPFVSPRGARFKTGTGGFGHAFQMVSDGAAYQRLYDLLGFRLSDYIDFAPGLTGTFLHCNPRHHSFAHAAIPGVPNHVNHLMFEVDDFDLIGRAWDKVLAGAAPVAASFGKHSNDEMLSFYVKTPSGFQVEYGFGGRLIDDATYTPTRYDVASYWGHKQSDPGQPDI